MNSYFSISFFKKNSHIYMKNKKSYDLQYDSQYVLIHPLRRFAIRFQFSEQCQPPTKISYFLYGEVVLRA